MNNDDPIISRENEIRLAQLSGDVPALDRLLDEALIFTALDGTLVTKADDLSLHLSGRVRITKMDPSDRHILMLGPTAVVSVRMETAAVIDGVEVAKTFRYTRVWCERPDGWRVVAG